MLGGRARLRACPGWVVNGRSDPAAPGPDVLPLWLHFKAGCEHHLAPHKDTPERARGISLCGVWLCYGGVWWRSSRQVGTAWVGEPPVLEPLLAREVRHLWCPRHLHKLRPQRKEGRRGRAMALKLMRGAQFSYLF